MSDRPKDPGDEDNKVGYGNPPRHTRFRKGQSGNPGGGWPSGKQTVDPWLG